MYDWISVKERLPSDESDNILTWDGDTMCAGTYYDRFNEKWCTIDDDEIDVDNIQEITHWFPFPSEPVKYKIFNIDKIDTVYKSLPEAS